MDEMRLQKFLAEAGVASRRKAEELIKEGRVTVNGVTVTEMGLKVSLKDFIKVDGKRAGFEERKVYIVLNKPSGYVTTVKDQFGRPTVIDLLKGVKERIYPVGRLDYDTSGLLLLTNDGELTYQLTHPKHEMPKVYVAEVMDVPDEEDIESFKKGIGIEDYTASPAEMKIIKDKSKDKLKDNKKTSTVSITIHEGRNREVRKMCDAIGHPVISLKRTAIGNLSLGDLQEGKWRYLNTGEIRSLKK